ncbi:LysR family transcriptional regulator, partial [Pseudomonas sp. ATCC 13867]
RCYESRSLAGSRRYLPTRSRDLIGYLIDRLPKLPVFEAM